MVRFVLRNYAVRSGKAKRFVLRIIKYCGIEGVLIVPAVAFVLQACIGRIQILKMINGTAKGIWLK